MRSTLVLVFLVVGCKKADRAEAPVPVVARPATTGDEPLPEGEEDDLLLRASPHGDDLELRAPNGGTAILTSSSIVASDPQSGGLFLEAVAKWLRVPVPPRTHTRPLRPFVFDVIPMGDQAEGERVWSYDKAFFRRGAEYAELYINRSKDGRFVVFRPKDSGYAEPLADMLADALRDGPAPPRTKATDPSLESEEPLFRLRALPDQVEASLSLCGNSSWSRVATGPGRRVRFETRGWKGGAAREVCTLPGPVDRFAVSVRGVRAVAVISEHSEGPNVVSSSDRAELWALSAEGCTKITPSEPLAIGAFTDLLVSPDGTQVALDLSGALVFVEISSGTVTRVPLGEGYFSVWRWDDDGPIVRALMKEDFVRVRPGQAVTPLETASWRSLDGSVRATLGHGRLDISRDGRRSAFVPTLRADLRALRRWGDEAPLPLGPHGLVLAGTPDLVLDLHTLTTRQLASPGTKLVCASPDGRNAVFIDEREASFEGTVETKKR